MSVGQHAPALRTVCILDTGSWGRGEGKARAQHTSTSCERQGGLATAGFSLSGRARDRKRAVGERTPDPGPGSQSPGLVRVCGSRWRWVVRAPPSARQPR